MRLSKWALNIITSILIKERLREMRHRKRGGNMTTAAKVGVMWAPAKNDGSHQKLEEARNRFSPRASGGSAAQLIP